MCNTHRVFLDFQFRTLDLFRTRLSPVVVMDVLSVIILLSLRRLHVCTFNNRLVFCTRCISNWKYVRGVQETAVPSYDSQSTPFAKAVNDVWHRIACNAYRNVSIAFVFGGLVSWFPAATSAESISISWPVSRKLFEHILCRTADESCLFGTSSLKGTALHF